MLSIIDLVMLAADRVGQVHKQSLATIIGLIVAMLSVASIEAFDLDGLFLLAALACQGAALLYAAYVYQKALRAEADVYRVLAKILTEVSNENDH